MLMLLKLTFVLMLFYAIVSCQEGVAPEEVVKFGAEYMELDSWVRRRQYTALKDALGTGVTLHLQVKKSSSFPDLFADSSVRCSY